jgi:imidazolonepropionase-like amidohydrolase
MKQAGVALTPTLTLWRYELRHERMSLAPAERFGAAQQLGRIAPGLAADLTLLRNGPSKDIGALATVQYTIRDGTVMYRGRVR